ncbi:hypothetical protein FHX52_4585 [Humibacillus xanthopallidus]|uniref:Uncharacterized protein n=1 Tax=Humibacillus xanthopallidus TaxID=412689 RepID=A0A543PMN2_9MICO|nr:hypothetical protein [Humibacillus xanthopallidus]TQN45345.1 hypothetical protein FHX52_4585 [Humibacillus xanthopallidus]
MTTTIRPTRQAQRVHMSHLATTHRAPLVPRRPRSAGPRPTSFIPMAREPLADATPHQHSDHSDHDEH